MVPDALERVPEMMDTPPILSTLLKQPSLRGLLLFFALKVNKKKTPLFNDVFL